MLHLLRQRTLWTRLPQAAAIALLMASCAPQEDSKTSAASQASATGTAVAANASTGEPATPGSAPLMRRLTAAQYYQSIADIFGPDITIGSKFSPLARTDGLMAIGASAVAVPPSAFEDFDSVARSIAAQAVASSRRKFIFPCKPAAENLPDDKCAGEFLGNVGKLLYRRPLAREELKERVAVARTATDVVGNFYEGISYALASMLQSTNFIFVTDVVERDPRNKGAQRLDGYSIASRLSFLLWNQSPDLELLNAAARGELHTPEGLQRQTDRLISSPRFEYGVRAFFSDMLEFDRFDDLSKDPVIYPSFNVDVIADAKEQTLRTIADHLVNQKGDYRKLFTTRKTFVSRPLGTIYNVPVRGTAPWVPYEFSNDDPRAGILTELSFTALHSHPGRSSATLRGKAVREIFLCQKVPDPPGNVAFDIVEDAGNPLMKTARQRMSNHAHEPMCAGCHKVTDPIGLVLESFDGAGQTRTTENGVIIDTTGDLNGVALQNAANLGKAMHDNPAATSCLVKRAYEYAAGRKSSPAEKAWVSYLDKKFSASGYTIQALFRDIATSRAFYAVNTPST